MRDRLPIAAMVLKQTKYSGDEYALKEWEKEVPPTPALQDLTD